ncbi:MAG: putative esterase of the alpha-beta hydrolase superfamily, partial [Evtepia sp.]|nr:putative esterase of the alpha-beta hydrolase superfamily [Evtepia sp.]
MEQKHSCLVLEGGALRGVYTSGVQGVLHRNHMQFDCLVGTSAGAMNAANFLSHQPERSFFIDYHFARDKNFMGLRPLIREGQVFSFQYMFGTVNENYPLDLDAFYASPMRLIAVATDYATGNPVYLERANCSDMM